jgi:hypothetical protein
MTTHKTGCPAYNTKGRELADRPCECGPRSVKPDKDMTVQELLECFGEIAKAK